MLHPTKSSQILLGHIYNFKLPFQLASVKCYIQTRSGPYLFYNIWGIFAMSNVGQVRLTHWLANADLWFDTFGPCLQFYIWATSGLHPFCPGHKKASSAVSIALSGPHRMLSGYTSESDHFNVDPPFHKRDLIRSQIWLIQFSSNASGGFQWLESFKSVLNVRL